MTRNNRISLLIIGLILFMAAIYGKGPFMEYVGKLFLFSIAACLTLISIRGE